MKRKAVYPGTFDPVTNSHLDLVERSRKIFDTVIVAVTNNPAKAPLFSIDERLAFVKDAVGKFDNVKVDKFDGLLVDYAMKVGGVAIIRGLRAVSDFEYELQMALMNRRLSQGSVETVFMMPPEEYSFLSSTMVKEVASFGGPVKGLVPRKVAEALRRKFKQ
jgi:pantetheine-phosphate adenylyltransferase